MKTKGDYKHWEDSQYSASVLTDKVVTFLSMSGNFTNIEEYDDYLIKQLDLNAGMDVLCQTGSHMYGIAQRIQSISSLHPCYNTFTVRSERHTGTITELQKRKEAIENEYLYPKYTLQAYIDTNNNNNIRSAAYIKTKDLFNFVETHPELVSKNSSDNEFIYVDWKDLANNNYSIITRGEHNNITASLADEKAIMRNKLKIN